MNKIGRWVSETAGKREAFLLTEAEWPAWDRFVSEHRNGTVYHLSGWKRFLEAAFPHIKGEFVALRDHDSRQITAGISLYETKSVFLGKRMISTPFATLGGALTSSPGEITRLMAAVGQTAARAGARRLEIRGVRGQAMNEIPPLAPSSRFSHHYLELPDSPGKLSPRFSRLVRRSIAKSLKEGIEIREENSDEILNDFSSMHQSERRRLGLPAFPPRFFHALRKHMPLSSVSLLVAARQGEVLGMFLILQDRDWSIAEYIVVTESGRKLGVSHLLYWESMVRSIKAGRKFYSLGRTASDSSGLLRFKRSWGGNEETLMTLSYPAPLYSRVSLSSFPLAGQAARFFFRTMPYPLWRALSTLFYRHWA